MRMDGWMRRKSAAGYDPQAGGKYVKAHLLNLLPA
jgi:hypothetical protein